MNTPLNTPLLSIAIPTWNRADILRLALDNLLPQLLPYKSQIEVIISDNGSTDHTSNVISAQKNKYNEIDFIEYRHESNTGYYGNFTKCRELASGKYFWLLSDNDYVVNGIVKEVLDALVEGNPTFVFISDWGEYNNQKPVFIKHTQVAMPIEQALEKYHYKLTLTSAVIFKNNKEGDTTFLELLKGNAFIGYVFFLTSLSNKGNAKVILGKGLLTNYADISFNVFYAFSVELKKCLKYATGKNLISNVIEQWTINNAIKDLTANHYISYRLNGKVFGDKITTKDGIELMLRNGFVEYEGYNKYLEPLFGFSKQKLKLIYYKKKVYRKLTKKLKQDA